MDRSNSERVLDLKNPGYIRRVMHTAMNIHRLQLTRYYFRYRFYVRQNWSCVYRKDGEFNASQAICIAYLWLDAQVCISRPRQAPSGDVGNLQHPKNICLWGVGALVLDSWCDQCVRKVRLWYIAWWLGPCFPCEHICWISRWCYSPLNFLSRFCVVQSCRSAGLFESFILRIVHSSHGRFFAYHTLRFISPRTPSLENALIVVAGLDSKHKFCF